MLSRGSGPPTSTLTISGSGYGAHKLVGIYFDTTERTLVRTNSHGAFAGVAVLVPAWAVPGWHYVTAVQRCSGRGAQEKFLVNTNWAQDGFSARHTGLNPYENVLSPSDVSGLSLDWTYPVGSDEEAEAEPSPAVVNGVVYISGTPNPNTPEGPSQVYALNAETGRKLWGFTAGGSNIGGTPAVANGTVYTSGGDPNVYALSAATGKVRWSFRTGGNVVWSPSVASGVVYVGSDDGHVYALSADTGRELWSFPTRGVVISSPTVANRVVYVGSGDGNIYALSARTGRRIWTFATGAGIFYSNVAVANGVAYAANVAGDVYALNAASGTELWSFSSGSAIASPLAVADGVVYIDTAAPPDKVYALSAAAGKQLWSFTAGSPIDSASPTVANGVIYVGSTDNNMYALNAATGDRLWSFVTGAIESSPAVANGTVYVSSDAGSIYAFNLPAAPVDRPSIRQLHPK